MPQRPSSKTTLQLRLTIVVGGWDTLPLVRKLSFKLWGFRSVREAQALGLGALERQVLEQVWKSGTMSVRDVQRALGDDSAYTTIMTTLDRLYRKRLLKRRKEGRAFFYSPAMSKEEFEHSVAKDIIGGLLDRGAEPIIASIVDAVSDHDRELLDDLERLVREKRRLLRKEDERA